ncbi:MAG: hypothetical protein ABI766_07895 [Gemmatimonadales bacterium]
MSVLIDGHVHLHDCYSPTAFLESARRNFDLAGQRLGRSALPGVLMLTESEGIDWFGRLARQAAGQTTGDRIPLDPWTIESTPDPAALWATSGDRKLLLLAGRQVVAREGLEVLVLGTTAKISDGLSLEQALAEGAAHGALRVIPWGAGKWLFGRGRLLSGIILAQRMNDDFFLGDGAGRPFFWSTPNHFAEAARHGIRVLPGTDPLPFPSQESRAGSFGFLLQGVMDLSRPAEGIKAALRDPASRLTPFGKPERALPFVRNQIAMQRRKRRA